MAYGGVGGGPVGRGAPGYKNFPTTYRYTPTVIYTSKTMAVVTPDPEFKNRPQTLGRFFPYPWGRGRA